MPDNLDDSYEELSGDDYLGLDNKTLIEFNYYIDQMLDDLDSDRIDEKTSVTTSIFNTVRSQCDNYPENGPLIWAFIQESCHDFYKNKLQRMNVRRIRRRFNTRSLGIELAEVFKVCTPFDSSFFSNR